MLGRYGLAEADRHFSVFLSHAQTGLSGQADLILEGKDCLAVVEFKASAAPLAENHRLQLAAYAMMAEAEYGKPCPKAFALFVDRAEMEEFEIGGVLRKAVGGNVEAMRRLLRDQGFPPPTPIRERCVDCEFRNFCGDVF